MKAKSTYLKCIVAALAAIVTFSLPATAQDGGQDTAAAVAPEADTLDELFAELQEATPAEAPRLEQKIWDSWSRSGSPSFDLLLSRGREAMDEGNNAAAIEHFTALTDHAPDFAEGWNMRATAYFRAGLYGPAMADLQQALTLNPRHFGALFGLGVLLTETGDPEGARAAFSMVRELHPNHSELAGALERLDRENGAWEL